MLICSNANYLANKLTHFVYCSCRCMKCSIQLPSDFSVAGASFRQLGGNCPLKRDLATSSSSLSMPTSPAKAYQMTNISVDVA